MDNLPPALINITEPEDIVLLKNAEGMSVGGNFILPSGLELGKPPAGHRWVVHVKGSRIQIVAEA